MNFPRISWMSGGFPWIWTGFSTDFMNLGWIFLGILAGFPWIWHGFSTDFIDVGWISMVSRLTSKPPLLSPSIRISMDFMDVGWLSMDLDWIFYRFHGSGVDFPWNSWTSAGFPWIWHGFSTDVMDVG